MFIHKKHYLKILKRVDRTTTTTIIIMVIIVKEIETTTFQVKLYRIWISKLFDCKISFYTKDDNFNYNNQGNNFNTGYNNPSGGYQSKIKLNKLNFY
jgi:hypothetical protein